MLPDLPYANLTSLCRRKQSSFSIQKHLTPVLPDLTASGPSRHSRALIDLDCRQLSPTLSHRSVASGLWQHWPKIEDTKTCVLVPQVASLKSLTESKGSEFIYSSLRPQRFSNLVVPEPFFLQFMSLADIGCYPPFLPHTLLTLAGRKLHHPPLQSNRGGWWLYQ